SKTELAALIHLCNGTLLNTLPIATPNDPSILTIVLCDKLLPFESSNQQRLLERSRANGVNYLSPEWVLESIVQFSLQPFDHYEEKF
ncbi:unnamed protein product, partial [Rotaria magnacalcarata]